MTDEKIIEIAQEAGWSGCDPAVREKLIAFGKLIITHKNRGHKINMKAYKKKLKVTYGIEKG